jgi:hypothetical protein
MLYPTVSSRTPVDPDVTMTRSTGKRAHMIFQIEITAETGRLAATNIAISIPELELTTKEMISHQYFCVDLGLERMFFALLECFIKVKLLLFEERPC